MDLHAALLQPLLTGLPEDDRQWIVSRIEQARQAQLDQKLHPPRRRRRGSDGHLMPLSPERSMQA
jgi:hypothetical protein